MNEYTIYHYTQPPNAFSETGHPVYELQSFRDENFFSLAETIAYNRGATKLILEVKDQDGNIRHWVYQSPDKKTQIEIIKYA